MQRIGKQKQSVGNRGIVRGQHGSHAAAIGVSAQEETSAHKLSQSLGRMTKSRLILLRGSHRRTLRTRLPKGQIAAQNSYALYAKRFGKSNQ